MNLQKHLPVSFLLSIIILVITSACSGPAGDKKSAGDQDSRFAKVDGSKFRDHLGRELILNGINLIDKEASRGYTCALTETDFVNVRAWGFNVVRLGIIWDGLEPEPGVYSEEMFLCLDERIRWASENGIYVMLDMHQDLYSVQFSDGAPEWATLTDGQPHQTGAVWSDAYLISPAVQTAFDNFWINKPASDGVGVQDHYANLWKTIAERYADEPAVIGYDIMNEPFIGSQAQVFFPAMVEAYLGIFAEEIMAAGLTPEEVAGMWSYPEGRAQILENMRDTAIYSRVVCAVQEMNQVFESGLLMDMYARVGAAIREVDPNHILFLEHSYFSNPGVPSGIERIVYSDGSKEENMAYAPHGYDLVVDTDAYKNASNERVEYLFDLCKQTAERLDMPMLVGEWGAFHSKDSSFVTQTRRILKKFEEYKCAQTFWAHYKGIEDYPFFNELIRPYPMAVAGNLLAYSYDPEAESFSCSWTESGESEIVSEFYLPRIEGADELDISLSPEGKGYELVSREGVPGLILEVKASSKNENRELTITF